MGALALYPGPGQEPAREPLLRGSKTLVLAVYVAQRPDRTASREHLAELFWPGRPTRGRRSLRQALYYLARSGGEGILVAEGERVRFRPDLCSVDAERFEIALREGRYEDAVGLHEGPFLAGFEAGPSRELAHWIESVRERLEVGLRQALRESARTALVRGDFDGAISFGRRATRLFPLDDGLHALLLEALVQAGRPGEAVREYEAFRVLLREQLEDSPSADLTEIAERARAAAAVPVFPGEAGPREHPEPETRAPATADVSSQSAQPARSEPPAEAGADRVRGARRTERRVLRVLGLVIAGLAATWLVSVLLSSVHRSPAGSTDGADGDDTTVLLRVQTDATGFAVVAVRGDPPRLERIVATEMPATLVVTSPDGRLRARRVPTPSGPDIAIDDARTGDVIAQVPNRDGRTPDDHIQGWSPDGRQLLFDSGLPTRDGGYDQRLFAFDVARGSLRAVSDLQLAPARAAAWSPRGDAIALVGYRADADRRAAPPRTDLFLVTPSGERIRRLTDDDAMEQAPAWSPDGTRIAFQRGPPGEGDIRVVDVDGGAPVPVASTAWSEESPVWLSSGWLAFTVDRGSGPELWAVPAIGGESRPLAEGTRIASIVQRLGPLGSVPWVERVRAGVPAPGGSLSPGEHTRLQVEIAASDSTSLPPNMLPFAWWSLVPDRAAPIGESLLLVRDTGRVRLVADVGGWRSDTVTLPSRPLMAADIQPTLAETWASEIDAGTWRSFGYPSPQALGAGGPEGGGRFESRGDANGESGVVTRRRFSLETGLTVETWGRVPLTGAMFQTFTVGLASDTADHPGTMTAPLADVAAIHLMSAGPEASETAFLSSAEIRLALPEPERIDSWRRHALQFHPDGALEWLIDGRRFASARVALPIPDSAHVLLGGRSAGTRIEHGPVRVWEGLRYVPVRNLPVEKP
jgi:DNA-binding SARP family transcriptional activator